MRVVWLIAEKVAWSHASVGGIPLSRALPDTSLDKSAIASETKQKAAAIMESKGSTAFGIGGVTASICKSILFDERNVAPISCWQDGLGVCLSMPVVLGRQGVVRQIEVELSQAEEKEVRASAESLKKVIEDAEKEQGEGKEKESKL